MVRHFVSSTGLSIKVGQNAQENQKLCREARQKDLWFHLEKCPSPHAILEIGNSKASELSSSIRDCALLVKHFSKKKTAPQASVIYIEAKLVSKSGVEDKTGAVSLKKSPKKVSVYNNEEALKRLLSKER